MYPIKQAGNLQQSHPIAIDGRSHTMAPAAVCVLNPLNGTHIAILVEDYAQAAFTPHWQRTIMCKHIHGRARAEEQHFRMIQSAICLVIRQLQRHIELH